MRVLAITRAVRVREGYWGCKTVGWVHWDGQHLPLRKGAASGKASPTPGHRRVDDQVSLRKK